MREIGATVDDFSIPNLLTRTYDVWHLHWPEHFLNRDAAVAASFNLGKHLGALEWARKRGAKIVWTVHNVRSHEQRHPKLESLFWSGFTKRIDAFITLTNAGLAVVRETFGSLRGRPGFFIPHGHYRDEYPLRLSQSEAREQLATGPKDRVFLFFGSLRKYKNVSQLIRVFRQMSGADWKLFVVGRPGYMELQREIRDLASSDSRICFVPGFVPPDRVQTYFAACDVVVLPFVDAFNSGSSILAVSLNRPVLLPASNTLAELQQTVGREWVRTFTGELNAEELQTAMQWSRSTSRDATAPLHELEWKGIAEKTLDAFRQVVSV